MDFGGGDEIRFERIGKAGIVTLTRPKALNALTHRMVKALSAGADRLGGGHAASRSSSSRPRAGRSPPAATFWRSTRPGRRASGSTEFFADEYRLNAQIDRFKKPYVSLIDGIVHGRRRRHLRAMARTG